MLSIYEDGRKEEREKETAHINNTVHLCSTQLLSMLRFLSTNKITFESDLSLSSRSYFCGASSYSAQAVSELVVREERTVQDLL